jgi:hypothetical protein
MSIGGGKISVKARGDTLLASQLNAYDIALDRCAECSAIYWPGREDIEGNRDPHVFERTIHQGQLGIGEAISTRILPWFTSANKVECGQLEVERIGATGVSTLTVVSYASEWLTDHAGVGGVDPGEWLGQFDVGGRAELGWKWSWASGGIFRIRIPSHALCEGATIQSASVYSIATAATSTDFTGALVVLASNTTTPAIATTPTAAGALTNLECVCGIATAATVVDKTRSYFIELVRVGSAALNVHYVYKIAITYTNRLITPAQRYIP